MGSQHTEFNRQSIPQSWTDAAAEAHGASPGFDSPMSAANAARLVPGRNIDMFTGGFATAAMCMISGYAWFLINGNGITSPWLVVAIGMLIAMTLRLSAGEGEKTTRSVMALVFYLITVSVVFLVISAHNYQVLYGVTPTLGQLEQELFYGTLASVWTWAAAAVGGATTVLLSRLL